MVKKRSALRIILQMIQSESKFLKYQNQGKIYSFIHETN